MQGIPELFSTVTNFLRETVNNISLNQEQQDVFNEGLGYFDNIEKNFINYLSDGFSGVGNVISGVTNVFIILLMVPIILFFLLKDGSKFLSGFMDKVPPGTEDISAILRAIDTQVGGYIKGQIVIAVINGVLMFIGFSVIGLDYNGVLAVCPWGLIPNPLLRSNANLYSSSRHCLDRFVLDGRPTCNRLGRHSVYRKGI